MVSCCVQISHFQVKTRIEPPMTPPPNEELTLSPFPIQQVNLAPTDHEAEPSLLFNRPDTTKKKKGKGKEKGQSQRWFENLPPPRRNVRIYFFVHIFEKDSLSPKVAGPSRGQDAGDQPDCNLSPPSLTVEYLLEELSDI